MAAGLRAPGRLTGQTPQGMAVKAVASGAVSRAAWNTSLPPRSRRSSAPSYSSVRRMLCTSPGPSSSRDTLCAASTQTQGDGESPKHCQAPTYRPSALSYTISRSEKAVNSGSSCRLLRL